MRERECMLDDRDAFNRAEIFIRYEEGDRGD